MKTTCTIWPPANIYGKARIGRGVKIGAYCDIGAATIGDGVSIGAFAFIPGKITIKNNAWIGPRVTFTHTFPPATPDDWEETVVGQGAKIGASVTILCGIEIGDNAVIGAGSVVTRDVPAGETWAGVPARPINTKIT
ncbi:MAG TPA: acyltransferase [Syntrophales bacterium]|jgi:acetyltransferase-like isoleucine patch superfamily enzyme|nr:acyltransferase [Syntrophales bacterium]